MCHVSHKERILTMSEISCLDASKLVGVSDETIRRHVNQGLLPARRAGLRKTIWIDIDQLRSYAERYQYRFDEVMATRLSQNQSRRAGRLRPPDK